MVGDHLRLILAGLHMHHTGEDEVLWPLLLERAAPSTGLVRDMQAQHEQVDGYAEQLDPLLDDLDGGPTPSAGSSSRGCGELRGGTLRAPRPGGARDPATRLRHLSGRSGTASASTARTRCFRQLPLMFGAILEDADPDERGRMLAHLRRRCALVMRTAGAWQYRRYISRVRGR